MPDLERRDTQTIVKHMILDAYLNRWGGIIVNGLRRGYETVVRSGRSFQAKFTYVDCFAFQGRYALEGQDGDPIYGSPIIGIQGLDGISDMAQKEIGLRLETNAILIEKERANYSVLLDTLAQAGYADRIRETSDFSTLNAGDIAVIHGDCHAYVEKLLAYTGQEYTWGFYLLDPYGASGIPLSVVAPIISQQRNDVMINFPYLHLQRRVHPGILDEMYGSKEWRDVDDDSLSSEDREASLLEKYTELLQAQDPELAIKLTPVKFPGKERSMFYLFLTTHDPTGALAINEILDDARLQEYDLRVQWKTQRYRERKGSVQLSLFDSGMDDPAKPDVPRPSKEDIAGRLIESCRGETIKFRDVLRRVIDEPYYYQEVRSAMSLLRKRKQVRYKQLRNDEEVIFS